MIRIIVLIVLTVFGLYGCGTKKSSQSEVPNASKNIILEELQAVKGKGVLFGHQDDLAYGIDWHYLDGESDVKRVAGDYPAIFGWELGGIELEHEVNLDSVPFNEMARLAVWGAEKGGINTFSWHPFSPVDSVNAWHGGSIVVKHILPGGDYHAAFNTQLEKVASFFINLKDNTGAPIPFIFRPWHEMDGDWFWWGSKACSPDEFKQLFRYTIEYLQKKGIDNMVVAYSPDRNYETQEDYLTWYPGDDVVDILGVDNYSDLKEPEGEKDALRKLKVVIELANEKNKLSALTETGFEMVSDTTWYSQKLGFVLNDPLVKSNLSYVMVWRNDPKVHYFFPYPGHPAETDARELLRQPHILLLNEFNQLK